jgi:serine/threonine protein kinase
VNLRLSDRPSLHEPLALGCYSLFAELATGGMATVYLARQSGAGGFGRTVAVKRLHPHLARDPDFVAMFLDEARLAARVAHANVVSTLDVVTLADELFLVLEYIKGESLANLLKASVAGKTKPPVAVAVALVVDVLNGLHAAHEAKDEQGVPLSLVHRDVSPQNVLVGADGAARVLDFGIAKAAMRLQTTREGQLKGKLPYMAPEQISGTVTRASDVYSAAIVLWETLACQRLFKAPTDAQLIHTVMTQEVTPPSRANPEVPPELDRIVLTGLSRDAKDRFATAKDMAVALDACIRPASARRVTDWLESLAGPALEARAALVAEIESHSGDASHSEVRRLVGAMKFIKGDSGASLARMALSVPWDVDRPSGPPVPGSRQSAPVLSERPKVATKERGSSKAGTALGVLAVAAALGGAAWGASTLMSSRAPAPAAPPPSTLAPETREPSGPTKSAEDTIPKAALAEPSIPTSATTPTHVAGSASKHPPTKTTPRPPVTARSSAGEAPPKEPVPVATSPDEIVNSPSILDQH